MLCLGCCSVFLQNIFWVQIFFLNCRSSQQVCKEEYMECLYKQFCTETHKTAMRKFLEIISANTSSPPAVENDKPVTLKEG